MRPVRGVLVRDVLLCLAVAPVRFDTRSLRSRCSRGPSIRPAEGGDTGPSCQPRTSSSGSVPRAERATPLGGRWPWRWRPSVRCGERGPVTVRRRTARALFDCSLSVPRNCRFIGVRRRRGGSGRDGTASCYWQTLKQHVSNKR